MKRPLLLPLLLLSACTLLLKLDGPRDRATGAACVSDFQCSALSGNTASCEDFPGGYCTEPCDPARAALCQEGATCIPDADSPNKGACREQCDPLATESTCREEYFCSRNLAVCLPRLPEVCDDLVDNDLDGLPDCSDEDCACTAGDTPTGAPCQKAAECASAELDPFCFSEPALDFPAGYCSEFCDASTDTGCASGAKCIKSDESLPGDLGFCFDICVNDGECRNGYQCAQFEGASLCVPLCDSDAQCISSACNPTNQHCAPAREDCANPADEDLDGFADCEDTADCGADPSCKSEAAHCNDNIDNDDDNKFDCFDEDCQGTPDCTTFCGDGNITPPEECDPPNQGGCNAQCLFVGQELCQNLPNTLADDDNDGLPDCADPDCDGNSDCTTGPRLLGAACVTHNQCASFLLPPACLQEQIEVTLPDDNIVQTKPFSNGYCSAFCELGDVLSCGLGKACLAVSLDGDNFGMCFDECSLLGGLDFCRSDYTCVSVNGGFNNICLPN